MNPEAKAREATTSLRMLELIAGGFVCVHAWERERQAASRRKCVLYVAAQSVRARRLRETHSRFACHTTEGDNLGA